MKKIMFLLTVMVAGIMFVTGCGSTASNSNGEGEAQSPSDGQNVESYPEREIDVYVGHGPGGGTDSFVRTITDKISEIIDGNFNVINQEGGSGVVAMQEAMQQPSDGYTLIGDSAYAVTTAAGTNEYGLDQVKPIARVQSDTYALQVKSDRFEDIDELVEYAKNNPGELRFGAVGTMGIDEITARRFMNEAGIEMSYVPMEGAGEMHSDLLGGHIDVILEEVGPTISYIEEGDFKPLIFLAEERLEDFPEVPSSVEKGWEITDGVERYLMAPADTPQKIIDKLEEAAKEAMETEEYQEYEANAYLNLRDGWLSGEEFEEKLKKDIEKYKTIIEEDIK